MELPRIYDRQGREQDWDWLVSAFGSVKLERVDAAAGVNQVFRIVRLQVVEGTPIETVQVLDQQGSPMQGVRVVRAWADAPSLPDWLPPASRWSESGVYGVTDSSGEIGFGMGHGDTYALPGTGTGALWVAEDAGPSDLIDGLGILEGERPCHLDVTFQLQDVGVQPVLPPPPPAPPTSSPEPPPSVPGPPAGGDGWGEIMDKLDRILELLEGISREP